MRLHIPQRLALTAAGDRGDKTRLRVTQEKTRELATRVARRPDDRDLHRHCRILCGGPYIYAIQSGVPCAKGSRPPARQVVRARDRRAAIERIRRSWNVSAASSRRRCGTSDEAQDAVADPTARV